MSEKSANISKTGLQKKNFRWNSKDNQILGKVMKFQINSSYGSEVTAVFTPFLTKRLIT